MRTDIIERRGLRGSCGMTRRGFVGSAAAGLAMGATPLAHGPAKSATPVRGGHLVFGSSTGSTTDRLDPALATDWHGYVVTAAVCNYLVEVDSQKRLQPELATAWSADGTATRWVFELQKGIQFHNGKAFTAADAIYSLNRHRGEASTSPAKPLLNSVSEIRADGDHTLVFELSEPNADLPAALSTYQFAIVPDGHDDWTTLIGTGGYVMESYQPGVGFRGTRNPNYWKSDRAWLDSFETVVLLDTSARTTALITGAVDMIERADTKTLSHVKKRGGVQIIENVGTSYNSSAMDSRAAPFDDVNVRLALKYAVNREELVTKIANGYAVVANDHPVPSNDPYFNAEIAQKTYDPDRARSLISKAGLDGLTVQLSAADVAFGGAVDAATLMREQAKAAGIDIEVVREPNDGYWSDVWMKKPFSMVTWGNRATPSLQFEVAYACGAPWADGYLCHDRFEMLLKESKATTDFEKRKEIFGEMQQIQSEEGANHVFMFDSSVNIFSERVGGAAPDAMAPNLGMRAAERLWIVA